MIDVQIDSSVVTAKLKNMPDQVNKSMQKAIRTIVLNLRTHIVRDKLLGQVLNRKTGRLGQSIQTKVDTFPSEIVGIVYSAGDVKYAAIHEFGGEINHPGGTPYFYSKFLNRSFFVKKESAFSQALPVTRPHIIKMPERSYMRSSLKDMAEEISKRLNDAVNQGIA